MKWFSMWTNWRRPEDQDRELKEAAKRETERVKAVLQSLDLRIERASYQTMDDLMKRWEEQPIEQQ